MSSQEQRSRRVPAWLEILLLFGVALALSVLVKAFLVQMFFVPSGSMQPLLRTDDRILVEKISTWDGEVERGDVVVFADPGGWLGPTPPLGPVQRVLATVGLYPEGGHLVKRVVGLPGDRVACCDGQGRLTVNGEPIDEPYLAGEPSTTEFDVTVPEDRLWMMGDNRANSEDSRFNQQRVGGGAIPLDAVVGTVWGVVWPPGRFELIDRPEAYRELDETG